MDHLQALAGGDLNMVEKARSLGQTKSLHTFQYVLPPLRLSDRGRKINGSKVCCLLTRWPWAS